MALTVPGIYVNDRKSHHAKVKIDTSCVAGFVGIAERGPLQVPVRLTSFEKYQETFGGFSGPGVLAYAVYGFFNSGGEACVVIRTANESGETSVATAELSLLNEQKVAVGKLRARSPGTWGNRICCKFWYAIASRHEVLSGDLGEGAWVTVADPEDFLLGDTVRFQVCGQIVYRQVQGIEGNRLTFVQGVQDLWKVSSQGTKLERLGLNVTFSDGQRSEDHLFLSPNPQDPRYFARYINRASKVVEVVLDPGTSPGTLVEFGTQPLSGGRDGVVGIEPADFIGEYRGVGQGRALGILEAVPEVSVVAIPDFEVFGLTRSPEEAQAAVHEGQLALLNHAEKVPNRFAILDVPSFLPPEKLDLWSKKFDSMYGAMYYPPVQMLDPLDPRGIRTVPVPPSGHIAGIFAETDATEGSIRAPANKYIPGVVGLGAPVSDGTIEHLYQARINVLKSVPGRGIKVWGGRTLSSDIAWRYISVRRAFSRIASALKAGTLWAVFEPNDFDLRKRLIRHVSAFMIDLWHGGYLVGKTPEEAFFVRCDAELNPPENIDAGLITVRVGICLAKPAEFLVISIVSEREGSQIVIQENQD